MVLKHLDDLEEEGEVQEVEEGEGDQEGEEEDHCQQAAGQGFIFSPSHIRVQFLENLVHVAHFRVS